MESVVHLFANLACDLVGLHWLLAHRPDQLRTFEDQAAQVGRGNDIYFGGDAQAPGVGDALRDLPQGATIHAPVTWLGAISEAWSGKVNRLGCWEWRFPADAPPPEKAAPAVKVVPLTAALLHKLPETGLERLVEPYASTEEFLDLSFGFAVVQQAKIVAACTAFYIARSAADLATETYPSMRNNGFGAAVLRASLREALLRGLQPQVHASACNAPITRIVERLGFAPPETYELYGRLT
ncbi:MAG: GNAT family N-acetyltransferase [Phycisphaerales bacterium JB038]